MNQGIIRNFAILFIAACAHINWATAQNNTKNSPKKAPGTVCPAAEDIKAAQLYGMWQVVFTNPPSGLPPKATMLLEKHEEFSDSLQGVVMRPMPAGRGASLKKGHAVKAALAGDVEDGFVILDESSDNVSISGTWNGQLLESSCGREVTGQWKDTSASAAADAPDIAFVMKKLSGW